MIIGRRQFLKAMRAAAAAPMIVRASSLMPVRAIDLIGDGKCFGCRVPRGRHCGVCLCKIRDQMMPGLRAIEGRYEQLPDQWAKLFEKPGRYTIPASGVVEIGDGCHGRGIARLEAMFA